jgi:hypothetical protein
MRLRTAPAICRGTLLRTDFRREAIHAERGWTFMKSAKFSKADKDEDGTLDRHDSASLAGGGVP